MQAIACLPEERAAALSRVAEQERIEELRLRCGEAPSVRIGGAERPLSLAPVTAGSLAFDGLYLVLCFVPLLTDGKEALRWRRTQSNI